MSQADTANFEKAWGLQDSLCFQSFCPLEHTSHQASSPSLPPVLSLKCRDNIPSLSGSPHKPKLEHLKENIISLDLKC